MYVMHWEDHGRNMPFKHCLSQYIKAWFSSGSTLTLLRALQEHPGGTAMSTWTLQHTRTTVRKESQLTDNSFCYQDPAAPLALSLWSCLYLLTAVHKAM